MNHEHVIFASAPIIEITGVAELLTGTLLAAAFAAIPCIVCP